MNFSSTRLSVLSPDPIEHPALCLIIISPPTKSEADLSYPNALKYRNGNFI